MSAPTVTADDANVEVPTAADYFTARNRRLGQMYGIDGAKLLRWTTAMRGCQLVRLCYTVGRLYALVAELAENHSSCRTPECRLCMGIRDMLTALMAHDEASAVDQ